MYYDWKSNKLEFRDTLGKVFQLEFRGSRTIINGNSGTGKTYLTNYLGKMKYADDDNSLGNVFILNKDNKDKLLSGEVKHSLVVIDRGDIAVDEKVVECINNDRGINRYLIFIRKPVGIDITPNHFAELVDCGGVVRLKYRFNVKGWS